MELEKQVSCHFSSRGDIPEVEKEKVWLQEMNLKGVRKTLGVAEDTGRGVRKCLSVFPLPNI